MPRSAATSRFERRAIHAGVRPICQATKLLDPDPIVRRMAERDILVMGRAAKAYLDEQRARATPALRQAIDRMWKRIVAESRSLADRAWLRTLSGAGRGAQEFSTHIKYNPIAMKAARTTSSSSAIASPKQAANFALAPREACSAYPAEKGGPATRMLGPSKVSG
jgi:hypothetical protein